MGKNNRERRKQKKRAKEKRIAARASPAVSSAGSVRLTVERLQHQYLSGWSISANACAVDGHYAWMTERLRGYERIVEIGSGNGLSTCMLAKAGHVVVAVEENSACLAATEATLRTACVPVTVIKRGSMGVDEVHEVYDVEYSKIDVPLGALGSVLLIEGDVSNDKELERWMQRVGPFDGLACWLIGTHGGRRRNVQCLALETARDYRLSTQNRVYEVANEVLRKGGKATFVDRALVAPDDPQRAADINEHRAGHIEQASVTTMIVDQVLARPYTESEDEKRMKLIAQVSNEEELKKLNNKGTALLCVIAIKQ